MIASGKRGDVGFNVDRDVADEIIEVLEDSAVAVSLRNRHQLIESLADADGLEEPLRRSHWIDSNSAVSGAGVLAPLARHRNI